MRELSSHPVEYPGVEIIVAPGGGSVGDGVLAATTSPSQTSHKETSSLKIETMKILQNLLLKLLKYLLSDVIVFRKI
jgi:hypothetical protein